MITIWPQNRPISFSLARKRVFVFVFQISLVPKLQALFVTFFFFYVIFFSLCLTILLLLRFLNTHTSSVEAVVLARRLVRVLAAATSRSKNDPRHQTLKFGISTL